MKCSFPNPTHRCLVTTATLLLAFLLSTTAAIAEDNAPIKIGVIAPLSGQISSVGITVKDSVMLASKQRDPDKKVTFIFEDDNFLPKNSVTAARKLITQEKVAGIIIFGSSTALSIAPIIEAEKVPTISMALAESLTVNRPHMFRLFIHVDKLAQLAAEEITKRKYSSIATVTTIQDGMFALRDRVLAHSKVKSLADKEVAPGDTDLRATATAIAKLNPSAVLFALLTPQPAALAQQLRQVGYKGEFFSGPQIQIASDIATSNGALVGSWFATQDDRKAASFYADYQKEFGEIAMPDGIFGYEAARLFIDASKSGDILGYLNALHHFEGIHGNYTRIEPNIFVSPVAIKVITKDGFAFLE